MVNQTSVLQLLVFVGEPVDKEIKLVTKLDSDHSSGPGLYEISFWLNVDPEEMNLVCP